MESLDQFFAGRDWERIERATGWAITRDKKDPDLVFITLLARDGESYRVMCLCDGYPANAPSVAFVNAENSKGDPRAWPRGNGQFHQEVKPPANSFLCMPLTREGLSHHPEWKTNVAANVWDGARHTLMDIFNHLQRLLTSSDYAGRGGT